MSDETPMAICIGGPEAGHEYPARPPGTLIAVDVHAGDAADHIIGHWEYVAQHYTTEMGGIPVWVSRHQTVHETMMQLLNAYQQVHKGIR